MENTTTTRQLLTNLTIIFSFHCLIVKITAGFLIQCLLDEGERELGFNIQVNEVLVLISLELVGIGAEVAAILAALTLLTWKRLLYRK